MSTYVPIFNSECGVCDCEVVVGLRDTEHPNALIRSTGLCGPCFFGDSTMIDWELWNEQPDSTD